MLIYFGEERGCLIFNWNFLRSSLCLALLLLLCAFAESGSVFFVLSRQWVLIAVTSLLSTLFLRLNKPRSLSLSWYVMHCCPVFSLMAVHPPYCALIQSISHQFGWKGYLRECCRCFWSQGKQCHCSAFAHLLKRSCWVDQTLLALANSCLLFPVTKHFLCLEVAFGRIYSTDLSMNIKSTIVKLPLVLWIRYHLIFFFLFLVRWYIADASHNITQVILSSDIYL